MATTSPPRTPGPGPKSTIVVGRPHRLFVVLDDDDRVSQVAQLRERVQQPVVVARVQADRRLVEDVEHAHQSAADLAGQTDPLRLAAGERRGGALECEIVEPDVEQESQPAANFLEYLGGDDLPRFVELQVAEEIGRFGDRSARRPPGSERSGSLREVADAAWSSVTAAGLRVQPRRRASVAADHAHVLFELPPLHVAFGCCGISTRARE